jgi:hypothetical protein
LVDGSQTGRRRWPATRKLSISQRPGRDHDFHVPRVAPAASIRPMQGRGFGRASAFGRSPRVTCGSRGQQRARHRLHATRRRSRWLLGRSVGRVMGRLADGGANVGTDACKRNSCGEDRSIPRPTAPRAAGPHRRTRSAPSARPRRRCPHTTATESDQPGRRQRVFSEVPIVISRNLRWSGVTRPLQAGARWGRGSFRLLRTAADMAGLRRPLELTHRVAAPGCHRSGRAPARPIAPRPPSLLLRRAGSGPRCCADRSGWGVGAVWDRSRGHAGWLRRLSDWRSRSGPLARASHRASGCRREPRPSRDLGPRRE